MPKLREAETRQQSYFPKIIFVLNSIYFGRSCSHLMELLVELIYHMILELK